MKPQKWQIIESEDGPLEGSEVPFYWLEIVDISEEDEELKTINSCQICWEPDQRPSRDLRLMEKAPEMYEMLQYMSIDYPNDTRLNELLKYIDG